MYAFARPGVELSVFGLDPARAARHSDFWDLSGDARSVGAAYTPVRDLNDAFELEALRASAPDVICVFGWSRLIGPAVMEIPRIGVLGWHPAPLPENRGRAAIPWTILQRRRTSAITIFWIDQGVDTGDIAAQVSFPVAPDETATTLYEKVELAGREAIKQLLESGPPSAWPRRPQDHARATYCERRRPEDGLLNWERPADELWTLIRATTHPYPGAFTSRLGEKLVVWAADGPVPGTGQMRPGSVAELRSHHFRVRCGDGRDLWVREWAMGSSTARVTLGVGEVLGEERQ